MRKEKLTKSTKPKKNIATNNLDKTKQIILPPNLIRINLKEFIET